MVCLSQLLSEVAEPREVVEEVYRVLKPGGKILAVVPARYDVDFWFHVCFPWKRWLLRGGRAEPTKTVPFTGRELHRLFGRFIEHRIHKRQLRRSHVPHIWRWMPRSFLERIMGRMLILKAFNPLARP